MTTSGSNEHVGIVITAEDRASRTLRNVGTSLRRNLGSSIRSAALSMISFTSILSAVGLSITGLIVIFRNWIGDVIKTNRAVVQLGFQLQSMGFSADRAASAVDRLRNGLSRAAIQAIPGFTDAQRMLLASLGPASIARLDDMASKLSEVWNVERGKVLSDLTEFVLGNEDALKRYNITARDMDGVQEDVNKQFDTFINNQTKIQAAWRVIRISAGNTLRGLEADVNNIMGETGIVGVIRSSLNIIGGAFGTIGLGDRMIDEMTEMIDSIRSFFPTLFSRGRGMAMNIWFGFKSFLRESADFIEALNDRLLVRGNTLFEAGKDLIRGFFQGVVDGLQRFGQRAIDRLIGALNLAIGQVNRIPGVNIDSLSSPQLPSAPQFGRRVIQGQAHLRRGPNMFGGGPQPFREPTPREMVLQLNGREVARAQMEILDGQIRLHQPGTLIQ